MPMLAPPLLSKPPTSGPSFGGLGRARRLLLNAALREAFPQHPQHVLHRHALSKAQACILSAPGQQHPQHPQHPQRQQQRPAAGIRMPDHVAHYVCNARAHAPPCPTHAIPLPVPLYLAVPLYLVIFPSAQLSIPHAHLQVAQHHSVVQQVRHFTGRPLPALVRLQRLTQLAGLLADLGRDRGSSTVQYDTATAARALSCLMVCRMSIFRPVRPAQCRTSAQHPAPPPVHQSSSDRYQRAPASSLAASLASSLPLPPRLLVAASLASSLPPLPAHLLAQQLGVAQQASRPGGLGAVCRAAARGKVSFCRHVERDVNVGSPAPTPAAPSGRCAVPLSSARCRLTNPATPPLRPARPLLLHPPTHPHFKLGWEQTSPLLPSSPTFPSPLLPSLTRGQLHGLPPLRDGPLQR